MKFLPWFLFTNKILLSVLLLLAFTPSMVFAFDIEIVSPGSVIYLEDTESMPVRRAIKGTVSGLETQDIESGKYTIKVSIKTDKWYEQGETRIRSDGSWLIRTAHFGGRLHIIRAELFDNENNEVLESKDYKVKLVQ